MLQNEKKKSKKRDTLKNYTRDRNYWFVGDFETITPNTEYYKKHNETGVLLWSLCNWQTENFKNGVHIEEMFEYLTDLNTNITLFFHNLNFDGEFILQLFASDSDWKINNANKWKNKTFSVFRNGSKIYQINLCWGDKKGKYQIVIKDSYKMLSSSVNVLAKSLNMVKYSEQQALDKNFYNREPTETLEEIDKEYIDYCNNDTLVVLKSLKNFEKVIHSLKRINPKEFPVFKSKTSAGLSFRLMERYIHWFNYENNTKQSVKKITHIDNEIRDIISNYMYGGFNQFNELFLGNKKEVDNLFYIDRNSAYPAEMLNELPFGDILDNPPKNKSYCEYWEIHIKKAKIKPEYYNCVMLKNWKKLENKSLNRYVRELDNFTCYYYKEEFELIEKFYDLEIETIKVFYMQTLPFLREYASEVYNQRQIYSREGNNAFKQAIKIVLNAGYGCLAQRPEFKSFMYFEKDKVGDFEKDKVLEVEGKEYISRYESTAYEINPERYLLWVLQSTKEAKYARNLCAASRITAMERVCLYKLIAEINPNKFAYADTDSIIFYNLTQTEINKLNKYLGDSLGQWKIEEDKGVSFQVRGAKKYIMFDKEDSIVKKGFSGVGHKDFNFGALYKEHDWDSDIMIIEDAVLKPKRVKGGVILELINKEIKKGKL